MRLNRFLAASGFGSRRQCDELIREGRVDVDGEPVTELSTTVSPSDSKVRVDGVPLKRQKLVYYAVHKPVGVLTTNADPQGRPRVIDLIPPGERVFPVGRLDRSSEGLVLLTNDGELAQRLAHPRFGIRKVYRVVVAGRLDPETMRQMKRGIHIAEGLVHVDGARILKARERATEMEIVLREGKNREIRRILARLGHKVQQLRRVAIGPLRLGEIPPGAYRILSSDEIRRLHEAADAAERGETSGDSGGSPADTRRPGPKRPRTGPPRKGTASKGTASTGTARTGTARTGTAKQPTARKDAPDKRRSSSTNRKKRPADSSERPAPIGTVIGGDFETPKPRRPKSRPPNSAGRPAGGKPKPGGRSKPGGKSRIGGKPRSGGKPNHPKSRKRRG